MLKHGTKIRTAFCEYTIAASIGQGGAAHVFEAVESGGETVAVKVLAKATTDKERRFRNEIQLCMSQRHKHLIKVTDYGWCPTAAGDRPFLVMQRHRESLRKVIERGPVDPMKALDYVRQIADGLEVIHLLGCVHRDLKPENILVAVGGNLVVADLGIAHVVEELQATAVATQAGDRLANFRYASPEQRRVGETVGCAADLFALGLIWNELVTGKEPVGTGYATIGAVAKDAAWMDDVVSLLLRDDPAARLASVQDLRDEIERRQAVDLGRQRLNKLTGEVVAADPIQDPIYHRAVAVDDILVRGNDVVCVLNQQVSNEWCLTYMNSINMYTNMLSTRNISFAGDRAIVVAHGRHAEAVNYFQQWLGPAHTAWRAKCVIAQNKQLEARKAAVAKRAEEEQKRLDLLSLIGRKV